MVFTSTAKRWLQTNVCTDGLQRRGGLRNREQERLRLKKLTPASVPAVAPAGERAAASGKCAAGLSFDFGWAQGSARPIRTWAPVSLPTTPSHLSPSPRRGWGGGGGWPRPKRVAIPRLPLPTTPPPLAQGMLSLWGGVEGVAETGPIRHPWKAGTIPPKTTPPHPHYPLHPTTTNHPPPSPPLHQGRECGGRRMGVVVTGQTTNH